MRKLLIIFLFLLPAANSFARVTGLIGGGVIESLISVTNASTLSMDKSSSTSSTNNAVIAFTIGVNSGTDTLTDLFVILGGTCITSDIATNGVKLYVDENGDSEWDSGDTLVDTVSFSNGIASFTGLSVSISSTNIQYIITYDVASGATNGCTASGEVVSLETLNHVGNKSTSQAVLTVAVPVGPCSGSVVLDTFTGGSGHLTDHTSDSGHTWAFSPTTAPGGTLIGVTLASATLPFTGDVLADISTSFIENIVSSYVPVDADYIIRIDIIASNSGGEQSIAIAGRVDTGTNTRYRTRWSKTTEEWELTRIVSGSETVLDTFAGDSPNTVIRTVELRITDALKSVYIDGVLRMSSTDNTITAAGRPGINGGFVSASENQADNFCVFE